jgi:ubiquinone/menaquinone biosynthesis C-methylase UbiE
VNELMASPTLEKPEENPIEKIAASVYPPFAMLAGMQLDLFTPLKDGPMNTEQIALALNVGSAKLKPLLYALVVAGFLNVEGEFFSNTDAANRFLVKGGPSCVVDIHELLSTMWNAALKTAESIRTGLPQAKLNYSNMSQDELQHFFCGEHPYAVEYGRDLVERYNFSSYNTLLDVGGGSGGLAIAVTEACPNIKATVVDLPKVTPVTQHYIDEAGAGNRVKVAAADAVRGPLPGSYDAAIMSAFIQLLSPDDARCAIKNVSKVMNPGGEIYIRGYGIIDNSRTSPQKLVGFNLVYINVYDDGQAYTEQEHKDWLEEAGFGSFRRTILADGSSIITARKIK